MWSIGTYASYGYEIYEMRNLLSLWRRVIGVDSYR